MRLLGVAALAALVSCAHNVPQDSNTGKDGKPSGARALVLQNGEGHLAGIVTYPGGDRVDWRKVELPATSKLELEMTYTTPRPGLRVAFDVGEHEPKMHRHCAVLEELTSAAGATVRVNRSPAGHDRVGWRHALVRDVAWLLSEM